MIENEKQKEVTLKWLGEFKQAVKELEDLPEPTTQDEKLDRQLDVDAYASQIEEFEEELAVYEKEKSELLFGTDY